jgi:hypothetical protein
MTLTHAQLLDAVRAAGHGRESFTCADIRQQLGLSTGDKKQMNRFYSRFRALQNDPASQIEKLASNCYRLRVVASDPPAAEQRLEAAAPHGDPPSARTDDLVELISSGADEPPGLAIHMAESISPPASEPSPEPSALAAQALVQVAAIDAPPMEMEEAATADAATPPPAVHAPKPRAQWLSRMASFFGRRASKSDVGVAVGA